MSENTEEIVSLNENELRIQEAFKGLWLAISKLAERQVNTNLQLEKLHHENQKLKDANVTKDRSNYSNENEIADLLKLNETYLLKIDELNEIIIKNDEIIKNQELTKSQEELDSLFSFDSNSDHLNTIELLEKEKSELTIGINELQAESELLRDEVSKLNTDYQTKEDKYLQEINLIKSDSAKLQVEITALRDENIEFKQNVDLMKGREEREQELDFRQKLNSDYYEKEILLLNAKIHKLETELNEALNLNISIRDEHLAQKVEFNNEALNLTYQIERLNHEIDEWKSLLNEKSIIINGFNQLMLELESKSDDYVLLEKRISEQNQKLNLNEAKIEEAVKLNSELEAEIINYKTQIRSLSEQVSGLKLFENEFNLAQKNISELRSKISDLSFQLSQGRGENIELEKRIFEIYSDKQKFKIEFEHRIGMLINKFEKMLNSN